VRHNATSVAVSKSTGIGIGRFDLLLQLASLADHSKGEPAWTREDCSYEPLITYVEDRPNCVSAVRHREKFVESRSAVNGQLAARERWCS